MAQDDLNLRKKYVPSGRVDVKRFLPLAGVAIGVAALLALAMNAAYNSGWYFHLLFASFAGVIVSGFVYLAIWSGKCRSRKVGMVSGLAAGLVLYLGFFYFGMLTTIGRENAARVDLLPRYIQHRMATDVHRESRTDAPKYDPVYNWLNFGTEFAVVLFCTVILNSRRAGRCFCETCNQWQKQDIVLFPQGTGETIAQWLRQGEIANLARAEKFNAKGAQFTSVLVEVCRASQTPGGCPVYLSIKNVTRGGTLSQGNKFDGAMGKVVVNRIELSPAEAAAIAPAFPQLEVSQEALQTRPAETTAPRGARGGMIEVEDVLVGIEGTFINPVTLAICNGLILGQVIVFYAAIIGGFVAIYRLQGASGRVATLNALGLLLGAIVMATISGYLGLKNPVSIGNKYLRYKAKGVIRQRADKIVNPDRPGGMPTYFVELIPRSNWGAVKVEIATDIGFLQFEVAKKEARFEGNKQRMRFRASAIQQCVLRQVSGHRPYWFLVLSGVTASGMLEAPFGLRAADLMLPPDNRKRAGEAMYSHMIAMGVAPQAGTADVQPGLASQPSTVIQLPAKRRFLGFGALRVAIILLVFGLGLWRAHTERGNRAARQLQQVELGHTVSMPLKLSNLRSGQKLLEAPPYFEAGGSWTVFDCAPQDDPAAVFTVGVETPKPARGEIPISFSNAMILGTDAESGARLIKLLAAVLDGPVPAPRSPQPLKPVHFATAILGDHRSSPQQGLKESGGSWVASKWFIQNDGLDAEIFFNYDLTSMRAEFSEKDPDYSADVLLGLAAAVRDGPRPPRTPENDPNFTLDGPKVADLVAIPNSAGHGAYFGRGGKLLIVQSNDAGASAVGIPLENPGAQVTLVKVDKFLMHVVLADPDGGRLIAEERLLDIEQLFSATAKNRLWWIDRAKGVRQELTGAWGSQASLAAGDESLSPDGRYLAIAAVEGTLLDKTRTYVVYMRDMSTGKILKFSDTNVFLSGWTGEGASLRAVATLRGAYKEVPREILIDPATGKSAPGQPPLRITDDTVSPDGRYKLLVHPHQSIDVIELATDQRRTFTFHEDDQKFVNSDGFSWLSPRFVRFDAVRTGFIDIATMKMGFLPTYDVKGEPQGYLYSRDFKWAVAHTKEGVSVGRVVLPGEPITK